MSFWRAVAPHIVPVLVTATALFAAYQFGVSVTTDEYEAVIAKRDADAAEAKANAVQEARRQEQAAAAYIAFIDRVQEEALRNAIEARDDTIADLRSGALQLRERFTCSAARSSVPGTAPSTGLDHAPGEGGLQRTDAEFLVRFAGEADEVVIQLQACQAVLGLLISTPQQRTQEVANEQSLQVRHQEKTHQ